MFWRSHTTILSKVLGDGSTAKLMWKLGAALCTCSKSCISLVRWVSSSRFRPFSRAIISMARDSWGSCMEVPAALTFAPTKKSFRPVISRCSRPTSVWLTTLGGNLRSSILDVLNNGLFIILKLSQDEIELVGQIYLVADGLDDVMVHYTGHLG